MNLVSQHNLFQLIDEATRTSEYSNTLLDLIITDSPGLVLDSGTLAPISNSDHSVVYCSFSLSLFIRIYPSKGQFGTTKRPTSQNLTLLSLLLRGTPATKCMIRLTTWCHTGLTYFYQPQKTLFPLEKSLFGRGISHGLPHKLKSTSVKETELGNASREHLVVHALIPVTLAQR